MLLAGFGCGVGAPAGSRHAPPAGGAPTSGPVAATTPVTPPPLLLDAWAGYKHRFIQEDGRVVDPERGAATTSEGQSYAMLRSVWLDDRRTFDSTWDWTQRNLGDPARGRLGWLWGRGPDGGWRLLEATSATDADEDIALALIFAAHRWSPAYRAPALVLLDRIWNEEVTQVGGRPYLTAGNWAPNNPGGPVLNPSYFAPYAYRVFAAEDRSHPWAQLVASSYDALEACTDAPLEGRAGRLPPNWCSLDPADASARPARGVDRPNDYGYDAFRVMWRIALDARWYGEPRATAYLKSHDFLLQEWRRQGRLAAEYAHHGAVLNSADDPTVYGGAVGSFAVADPAAAQEVRVRLEGTAAKDGDSGILLGRATNYYCQNWVWFGLALAYGSLGNLAAR
jgi:endoglucanase